MQIELMEPYERKIIDAINTSSVDYSYKTIAVLMYSRQYNRPKEELPELLSRVAPFLKNAEIESAIEWLLSNGLLTPIISPNGYTIYTVKNTFPAELGRLLNFPEIENLFKDIKKHKRDTIQLISLGNVTSNNNYDTLISTIKNARTSIKYPLLSTAPYEAIVNTLKSVAENGVEVKLLIANDKIVKKYKGSTKRSRAEDWKEALRDVPNITIKIFDEEWITSLCTSILIDEKILRLVIYDPLTVSSLDGKLIEVENRYAQNINIITWFNNRFDNAWNSAAKDKTEKALKTLFSLTSISIVVFSVSILYLVNLYGINKKLDQIDLLLISPSGLYIFSKLYKYIIRIYPKIISIINRMK